MDVQHSTKRGGKWSALIAELRAQSGPIVAAALDNAERIAAELPGREVYTVPSWPSTGLICTYAHGELPHGAVRVTP